MIHEAARDPAGLSHGQQALCFAIYFLATLSLSDREYEAMNDRLSPKGSQQVQNTPTRTAKSSNIKSSRLDDLQSYVDTSLVAAKYASTNDVVILQALVLYIVGTFKRASFPSPDKVNRWQCEIELNLQPASP